MISNYGRRAQLQATWIKEIGRPAVIERDGEICQCCGTTDNLDVDHIKSKGSRPDLKRDVSNLQLLCDYPCHFRKTNHMLCLH